MAKIIQSPKTQQELSEWLQRVSARQVNPLMYISRDSVANSAGVATDLHSYTIPSIPGSYFWKSPDQYIRVISTGTFAANANGKKIEIRCSNATYAFNNPVNGGNYYAQVDFYKPDISTISVYGIIWTTNATYPIAMGAGIGYAAAGVRLGEGAELKTTATASGASDITETSFRVERHLSPGRY